MGARLLVAVRGRVGVMEPNKYSSGQVIEWRGMEAVVMEEPNESGEVLIRLYIPRFVVNVSEIAPKRTTART